ncbi:MAG: molybdate ABC transporter permease subunit [Proteobacteria bacterium]|nr:molybdate ABC transporter permease subunit [Desulfobulbaceae bacterium]MBU4151619.1 molybdate ABC transporter permease subunit [Pseudomonadota bacterium]
MTTVESIISPLSLTIKVAVLATAGAMIIGVTAAYLLSRKKFWGRDMLEVMLSLPLVLPPTVLGYYLLVVIGRKGFFGRWLYENFGVSLIFTWQGAVLAAMIVSLPLVFKSAGAAFAAVNKQCEEAAATLGASEVTIFFRVSLPLAWRGILAGSMMAFARAMGEFGATLMVAGNLPGRTQTLSMAVYDAVQAGDFQQANFLVVIITVVSAAILYGSGKLLQTTWR